MTSRMWIGSVIACTTLLQAALLAQDNPPRTQLEDTDVAGLPAARGVYYHAGNTWIALGFSVLMPFADGKSVILEVLNLGSEHAIEMLPGAHAGVQIGNNKRPTFYLRGITPSQVYMVRASIKVEHRELMMPISGNFQEWARYRAKDVTNMELQSIAVDVMTVRPLADLKPGEYVLASAFEPGAYWIRLGYDFGLMAGSTGN